jgi:hypothetical protein
VWDSFDWAKDWERLPIQEEFDWDSAGSESSFYNRENSIAGAGEARPFLSFSEALEKFWVWNSTRVPRRMPIVL